MPIAWRRSPAASAAIPGDRLGLRAFGLLELLVVIAILGVLMAILVPVLVKVRGSQRSVQCIANLRRISSALQAYTLDNDGRFPDPGVADKSWEQMIQKYNPGPLQCPSDSELFPAVGSSYDWRDTGKPSTTMAGHTIADMRRADAILVFEALSGWHNKGYINVVRIDGSAQTIDDQSCFQDLQTPVRDVDDSTTTTSNNSGTPP
jgi:prepilin-type N-terminal cleavage/methylation domain-containing protein